MTPSRKPARTQSQAKPGEKAPRGGKCPICGKPASADYSPFCSKRCADIDLNRWLSGRYAVPGEPAGSVVPGDKDEED